VVSAIADRLTVPVIFVAHAAHTQPTSQREMFHRMFFDAAAIVTTSDAVRHQLICDYGAAPKTWSSFLRKPGVPARHRPRPAGTRRTAHHSHLGTASPRQRHRVDDRCDEHPCGISNRRPATWSPDPRTPRFSHSKTTLTGTG
jgi:hypothetical protein